MRSLLAKTLALLGALHVSLGTADAQCSRWRTDLRLPGFDQNARAMVEHDDGSGPSLFVGGDFTSAVDVVCPTVARWDGQRWSAVGQFISGTVEALAVFDDGSGAALYAAGTDLLPDNILRWDGINWTSATGGSSVTEVHALLVFDDGSGPALYAAGRGIVPSVEASVARWTGSSWAAVGPAWGHIAVALAAHDDGSGPALYSADYIGASNTTSVRRWNGSSWTQIGTALPSKVHALASFDDGAGPTLWAGGQFQPSLGWGYGGLARWNGTSWFAVGSPAFDEVTCLRVLNWSGAPQLFVGGRTYTSIFNGDSLFEVQAWDGSTTRVLGHAMDGTPRALANFDSGAGPEVHACGEFRTIQGLSFAGMARFHGGAWTTLVPHSAPSNRVTCFSDPRGTGDVETYVGGDFQGVGDSRAGFVSRWTAEGWRGAGQGLDFTPRALRWFDDGGGPVLYAGGIDTGNFYPGGIEMPVLSRLVGSTWQPVPGRPDAPVYALEAFDDGSGPALFVAGGFGTTATFPNYGVRKYDGTSWASLGATPDDYVSALHVHDDGTGPALYAGGRFAAMGATVSPKIARWNGTTWSAVGAGIPGHSTTEVQALATHDDGTGTALYAGGRFSNGQIGVMKWDGASWTVVGPSTQPRVVSALTVWDDGTGPGLYALGRLNPALQVAHLCRWDGTSWTATGIGVEPQTANSFAQIDALHVFDDGSGNGPALLVGGLFSAIDGVPSGNFAVRQGCTATGVASCFGTFAACPCANGGAAGHGCANSVDAGGAELTLSGQPFVTADTLVLHGTGMTNGTALYFQGSTQAGGGAGVPFYDGLRCVSGPVLRLGIRSNSGGTSSVPEPGGASLSSRGLLPPAGGMRHYQVLYRDLAPAYCTPALANTSNALSVHWLP